MKPIYAALAAILLAGCQANTDPRTDLSVPLAGGDSLVCMAQGSFCDWRIVRAEREQPNMLREHLERQGFRP